MRGGRRAHAAHQKADGLDEIDYFGFRILARHGNFIISEERQPCKFSF